MSHLKREEKAAISPTRQENYTDWYQAVIQAADLAEHSPVRGCMVIKPWGYTLWENIQRVLDQKIKATGCQNAYFPLFIPVSLLEKEAKHVEGFAKECAVVTHHRLTLDENDKLVPSAPLEEPLVVRPTSETIIGEMFAKWIKSHRDLPLQINQWANIVRWEMRPRLFLRTTEFLWQEGHTAHASHEEAKARVMLQLEIYTALLKDYLAIPVIPGQKTESEKFPGGFATYTLEAMMQDCKALQAGTSHDLGQNFSKASHITFLNEQNELQHPWTTSWGVTTRLIGGLIMVHGDDNGIVLPPRIASKHIVILPIVHQETDRTKVMDYCTELANTLKNMTYFGYPLEIHIDTREMRGGDKVWSWVKKGVPITLEIGPREVDDHTVCMSRRDQSPRHKTTLSKDEFLQTVILQLDELHHFLYQKALKFQQIHTVSLNTKREFTEFFNGPGGFALCHWNGKPESEEQIKNALSVTIRCIPLDAPKEEGTCIWTGEPSIQRVIFAKSY